MRLEVSSPEESNDGIGVETLSIQLTPLETLMGFADAEEVYDLLALRDQLILDLMLAGWSTRDIAPVVGVSQSWVVILIQRIRYTIANSKLIHRADLRQHYRETNVKVTVLNQVEE